MIVANLSPENVIQLRWVVHQLLQHFGANSSLARTRAGVQQVAQQP